MSRKEDMDLIWNAWERCDEIQDYLIRSAKRRRRKGRHTLPEKHAMIGFLLRLTRALYREMAARRGHQYKPSRN